MDTLDNMLVSSSNSSNNYLISSFDELIDLSLPLLVERFDGSFDPTQKNVLVIEDVDFCFDTNGENHHTSQFNLMTRSVDRCLVVRRGQAFKLDLLLNRPYDTDRDAVSFIFYVADVEIRGPSAVTTAAVPLLKKGGKETLGAWSAVYEGQLDSHIMVAITPAADCIVAAWRFDIDTKLADEVTLSYTHSQPFYILFNPWCSHDSVYMPDQSYCEEYVQDDSGLIFIDREDTIPPKPWYYGQYEKDILECSLYLVREIGKIKGRARSDPIGTVRALSAAVNSNDDNGVLLGNWSGDYRHGIDPRTWIGSLKILQKYYETKTRVIYGQCWVYAGVLTTVCRALGIPCRPVTCFNAAHDTDGSLTIDFVYDNKGNRIQVEGHMPDSLWNFHVWNEVWMERPDLGSNYAGWQAVDATPQEPSGHLYRCGPTSLRAIRDGQLQIPYDVAFMFAAVNADKLVWKFSGRTGTYKLLECNKTEVGQYISTKSVGKMEREDITNLYKYPEGSKAERATMEKVLRKSHSKLARYYLNEAFDNIMFDLDLTQDVVIGQDFNIMLYVKNLSSEDQYQVKGILRVDTVTYTGAKGQNVVMKAFFLTMPPAAKNSIKIVVTFDEYYKKLIDEGFFRVSLISKVVDKNFDHYVQHDFRLMMPVIKIGLDRMPPVLLEQCIVTLKEENPLPVPLTSGEFFIHVAGLNEELHIWLNEDIAPGAIAFRHFSLRPPWVGRHQISAKFICEELKCDGYLSFIATRYTNWCLY